MAHWRVKPVWRHTKLVIATAVLAAAAAAAVRPGERAETVLWFDPGRVETLDFTGGLGGRARAPRPPFTFVDEDTSGTTPKVIVRDARGVTWTAKWGDEVKGEIFASRLAWACGYYTEPSYFVPVGRILKRGELFRAGRFVDQDGRFRDARFEMRPQRGRFRNDVDWTWEKNPFRGTHQLNGLKILVMLVSNWDNKDGSDVDGNTGIIEHRVDGRRRWTYLVTDWGASMGQWGGYFRREKWDCDEYKDQTSKFVGWDDGALEWGFEGKHDGNFKEGITAADVRWLMRYLGRVQDTQLRAALRASGADAHEVNCFTRSVRARIEQLRRVAAGTPGRQMRARSR